MADITLNILGIKKSVNPQFVLLSGKQFQGGVWKGTETKTPNQNNKRSDNDVIRATWSRSILRAHPTRLCARCEGETKGTPS